MESAAGPVRARTGLIALVTGAGSAKVAITSTTDRIFSRLEELGGGNGETFAKTADLTDSAMVGSLISSIEDALGPVDIIVNNAGMVQVGRDEPWTPLASTSEESWRYGIDINLTSAFIVTRAVLPGMIERNYGRIVHMSSVTGPLVGIAGSAAYGAAKAGMLGMARSLAIETGPHNITVNCIGPGWIKTASSDDAEILAGQYTPVGRPGTPDEVGHVAVFLSSEEASYITGQLLVVDGGNTIQEYKIAL